MPIMVSYSRRILWESTHRSFRFLGIRVQLVPLEASPWVSKTVRNSGSIWVILNPKEQRTMVLTDHIIYIYIFKIQNKKSQD